MLANTYEGCVTPDEGDDGDDDDDGANDDSGNTDTSVFAFSSFRAVTSVMKGRNRSKF